MNSPLRVLALVPYPTGHVPGQRYRIEQWAPLLAAAGVELEFRPFLDERGWRALQAPGRALIKLWHVVRGYGRRRRDVADAVRFDVAYVYREAGPLGSTHVERELATLVPFVLDFDDAIYLPAVSPVNAAFGWLKSPGKTVRLCRVARRVIVGNENLATFARGFAADVDVVPSTIDTDAYQPRTSPRAGRPVIGWTGSATTAPYLEALAPALTRLLAERDFELRVIGARPRLPGLTPTYVPWRAEREAADLADLDIGLMPLSDDPWSRGKCGMKALQYMGLGIPPVVAPVGVNVDVVRDGENGLWARSDDEWVAALRRLVDDPLLAARLGAAARRTVEDSYSARVQAPRVAAILRGAARP